MNRNLCVDMSMEISDDDPYRWTDMRGRIVKTTQADSYKRYWEGETQEPNQRKRNNAHGRKQRTESLMSLRPH